MLPDMGVPSIFNRGDCSNGVKERADVLEKRLLSDLQEAVLRPEAIEHAIQEFQRQSETVTAMLDNRIDQMRHRSQELQQELRNLASTVLSCGPSPALVEAINSREQEAKEITGTFSALCRIQSPRRLDASASS